MVRRLLILAGVLLSAAPASAQLDPLLFVKDTQPFVLLAVDVSNRMLRDAPADARCAPGAANSSQCDVTVANNTSNYFDPFIYTRSGANGEDKWNSLAKTCFDGGSSCPTKQIAIVLDGKVISAPVVQTSQFNGNVQISGNFTQKEAGDLAKILQFGAVPVKFDAPTVQTVSATLGKDSLHAALVSGLIGVLLVLAFLLFYYRAMALVVVAGLGVSGMLLWTVISWLSKTNGLALTLSGTAGIIVSIGVTVDSYVVFFERLKDDVQSGRTLRNSAVRGFESAWRTILAADTVSLLGAVILWWLTVGSVRGFAFFLGLSTLLDLILSYFVMHPLVSLMSRRGSLVGAMLPMLLRALRLDPATCSAPFVATLVDVTGIVIYFSIASLILHGTLL